MDGNSTASFVTSLPAPRVGRPDRIPTQSACGRTGRNAGFDAIEVDAPFSGVFERRSHVATMPALREAPTAAGVADEGSWDGIAPDAPLSLTSQPEWCVDLGEEMIALSAVELYARLATGSIDPGVKVWRVGRESWLPAREVPELRYAVEDAEGIELDWADLQFSNDGGLDDLEAALAFAKAG